MCSGILRFFIRCLRQLLFCLGLVKPVQKTHADSPNDQTSDSDHASSDRQVGFGNTDAHGIDACQMSRDGDTSISDNIDGRESNITDENSPEADAARRILEEAAKEAQRRQHEMKIACQRREATIQLKTAQLLSGGKNGDDALTMARAARLFARAADGFANCSEPQVRPSSLG